MIFNRVVCLLVSGAPFVVLHGLIYGDTFHVVGGGALGLAVWWATYSVGTTGLLAPANSPAVSLCAANTISSMLHAATRRIAAAGRAANRPR